VGHPEHDLLFIATQVARAAGLKHPSKSAMRAAQEEGSASLRASEALMDNLSTMRPEGIHAPLWHKMILLPEAETYQMLLRGHAPASSPFRKWVTEVVLPTIRKTGKFDIHEAQDETSQDFAGHFAKNTGLNP
jgi:prophage antirepressor-like protein